MVDITPIFFRLPQVLDKYGISKPTVYRLMKEGKFPKPVKLTGSRAVAWHKDSLTAWENGIRENAAK
jgi:prophage regulatory protein